jgi:hypothetical protein
MPGHIGHIDCLSIDRQRCHIKPPLGLHYADAVTENTTARNLKAGFVSVSNAMR